MLKSAARYPMGAAAPEVLSFPWVLATVVLVAEATGTAKQLSLIGAT